MNRLNFLWLLFLFFCSESYAQYPDSAGSQLSSDRDQAVFLGKQAQQQMRRGNFDSARYFLRKGLPYVNRTNDDSLQVRFHFDLANVLYYGGDVKEALQLIRQVEPLLATARLRSQRNSYYIYSALYLRKMGQQDSALINYNLAEQLNDSINPYLNFYIYLEKAMMYDELRDFTTAAAYFKKAYTLTKEKGARKDHGMVLSLSADFYFETGNITAFSELLTEYQQLWTNSPTAISGDPVHRLISIDWEKKTMEERIRFFLGVRKVLQENGSRTNAALANNYLATTYENNGQPAKALEYIRLNQSIFAEMQDLPARYLNTKIAVRLLKKSGNWEEALLQTEQLLQWKDSLIAHEKRQLLLDLETKYETEKKEQHIQLLETEASLDARDYELLETANQLHTREWLLEKNDREALERENRLMEAAMARDKAYAELVVRENATRDTQLLQAAALKQLLASENRLQTGQLKKEKNIRLLLMLLSLALLAGGVISFYFYRQQKAKKEIIQQQAEDLQMLMKEIHHRVKNNLQVISSLLDLQSLNIDDQKAAEAIRNSRNRVYSMALIHQNLYREHQLTGIEMPAYIDKLAESLFDSYRGEERNITLEKEVEPLLLDIDLVIPLGLVLNELMTNALKYAFIDRKDGVLFVGLRLRGDELELEVKDNGWGFPEGMNVSRSSSFGFKLVKAFAQKLKARMEWYNDEGACVKLHIRKFKELT